MSGTDGADVRMWSTNVENEKSIVRVLWSTRTVVVLVETRSRTNITIAKTYDLPAIIADKLIGSDMEE